MAGLLGADLRVTLQDRLPTGPQVRGRLQEAMRRATALIRQEIIRQLSGGSVRSRRGRLIAGLEQRVLRAGGTDLATGAVTFNKDVAHIARFLEMGTAPHTITPRGLTRARRARAARRAARFGRRQQRMARALTIGGGVFRASARHPGVRARRFLQAAGTAATPGIVAIFQAALRDLGSETAGVVGSSGASRGAA